MCEFQPLDVLMQSSELYFNSVPIPEELLKSLEIDAGLGSISEDGRTTNQYIVYLAETAQVIFHRERRGAALTMGMVKKRCF
jgi:hypothetical protein